MYNNLYSNLLKYRQRITTVLTSGVAIIFAALVASGFEFQFETFTTPMFYIHTLVNYAAMIFIYNTVKTDVVRTSKVAESGKYFKSKQRTNRYVKIARLEHLETMIDEAAEKETERRRIAACNRELNKHTYGLEMKDNNEISYGVQKLNNGTIKELTQDEFFEIRHFKRKEKKQVLESISKALNSQVKYVAVKGYEILTGYSYNDGINDDPAMSMNEKEQDIIDSSKKSITFILTTAVTNAIVWSSISTNFWVQLLTHATLILSSIASAMASAYQRIDKLTEIEVNRSDFLNQHIPEESLSKHYDILYPQTTQATQVANVEVKQETTTM